MGFKVSLLVFLFALPSFAGLSCNLSKLLGDDALASNTKFWEEFSTIKNTDANLEQLIRKHAPHLLDQKLKPAPTTAVVRRTVQVHKAAEKALGKDRNSRLYKRYEEFLEIMSDPKKGIDAISTKKSGEDSQGAKSGWHHKTLKTNKNKHTVRLNDDSRVLFEIREGEVHVLDIGTHVTH